VLQKLEAKWVKDRCRVLVLLVTCGRVQCVLSRKGKYCVWGKPQDVLLNSAFLLISID